MTRCLKISEPDRGAAARCVQPRAPRSLRLRAATTATGLALGLTTLASLPAPALAVDPPAANRIWHGCELSSALAGDLETLIDTQGGTSGSSAIDDRPDASIEVAFVVVYSLNNVNDGQPVGSAGFTGPIICAAPSFSVQPTTQTPDIPSADLLDAEDAFILRYRSDGNTQKRICHTVGSSTDCFRVF